jgi:hypothetical protein
MVDRDVADIDGQHPFVQQRANHVMDHDRLSHPAWSHQNHGSPDAVIEDKRPEETEIRSWTQPLHGSAQIGWVDPPGIIRGEPLDDLLFGNHLHGK